MNRLLKKIIYTRFFIVFSYYLIRLYSATFRMKIINERHWQNAVKSGKTVLLCAWHQQFFSVIRHFKTYAKFNPALMISQSRDGELIAGVAQKTGWHTARGSSSKDGKKAMNAMIEHLKKYGLGAHLVDGPTGPMGKVKAGAIKMAQESNAVIVPFYTYAPKAWFFNSWDRFMLPRPFSTVVLTYGEALVFEKDSSKEGFEAQRHLLEATMLDHLLHKRPEKHTA